MSDYKQPLSLSDSVAHLPAAKGLTMEDRVGINEMKTQLEALWPKYSDVIKNLTPSVRKQVEALRGIESQHKELEAKFRDERAALEARYYKLYSPLYSKRYHIVNGIGVVGEAEEDANDKTDDTAEKGVPEFWLTAMKNNEITADEIRKRDEEALKYLKDIKWVRMDEPNSFKLEFFFEKNPFFKNSLLTKEYFLSDDSRHPDLVHLAGTTIEWLPGKCLTQKVLMKKPKMGSKDAKPITKTEDCESFFNFFSPVVTAEEMDEDTAEDIKNQMSQDYVIGSTIKEEIIPHPVSWYTGEANEDFRGCAEKLYMLSLACGQTREGLLRALVTKGP